MACRENQITVQKRAVCACVYVFCSLDVPPLEVLYPRHPPLRIADHFRKEVTEAGAAELCGSGPVQIAIVNGFAVRGVSKS